MPPQPLFQIQQQQQVRVPVPAALEAAQERRKAILLRRPPQDSRSAAQGVRCKHPQTDPPNRSRLRKVPPSQALLLERTVGTAHPLIILAITPVPGTPGMQETQRRFPA